MRRIIASLSIWLIASIGYGQLEVNIRPTICPKTVSTAFQTRGKDTIYSKLTTAFDSVAVGAQIYGPGFKVGTTVLTISSTGDTLKLSDTSLVTQDSVAFQIGILRGAAYASGDWVGFPFKLWDGDKSGSWATLVSAHIIDNADALTATDIDFFTSPSGDEGLDNVAIAYPAADEAGALGFVSVATITDLGAVRIGTLNNIYQLLPRGKTVWGRLVCRNGTPAWTTMSNLRVRLRFE
jgi:hypothetical protein